jgi:hypothetical protein
MTAQSEPDGARKRLGISVGGSERCRHGGELALLGFASAPLGALIWFLLPTGHDEPTGSSRSAADPSPVTSGLYLTNVPNNWVSIGTVPDGYVGHDIYNRVGEKLGRIKDILLDPDERMVAAITPEALRVDQVMKRAFARTALIFVHQCRPFPRYR